MSKKRIIVLGGGISGLTLAYDLAKRFEVRLIEKEERLGGWVGSDMSTGFFFEKGPRVFRGSRCAPLLKLVEEIGLLQELVESSREGRDRYVWAEGKLRKMPQLSWRLLKGVIRELWVPAAQNVDESVWDFACRRFNVSVAKQVFDPLVVGIYGGNAKELSVRSCFSLYKRMEEQHGSVVRGLLRQKRFEGPYMFGFQRGVQSVIQRLQERSAVCFHLGEEVLGVLKKGEGYVVKTSLGEYEADDLFSALPAHVVGKFLAPELAHLPMEGTTIVNLGYKKRVLNKQGFGYLVASHEKEDVLGVVFDSCVFPQYNRWPEETRLTVKLRKDTFSDDEARSLALKGIAKHLRIRALPDVSMVTRAPQVFPQFLVGHHARMEALEQELKIRHPRLKLVGNYLYGVGVSDCIERARSVAENFLKEVAS